MSLTHGGAEAPPPTAAQAVGSGVEPAASPPRPPWTLLTNHGHVLLAVARSQDVLVSEIAAQVGITTRATLTILKDLESAGYLHRQRVGRRTHYTVDTHQHFRHPATATHEVGELLAIFSPPVHHDSQGLVVSRATPEDTHESGNRHLGPR